MKLCVPTAVPLIVALVGCDPGGPEEPLGAEVELSLLGFDALTTTTPVRVAVAWTYRSKRGFGIFTTSDVAVDRETDGQSLFVRLPPSELRDDVAPTEPLFLGYSNNQPLTTAAYRPRFVVYDDRNENGRFDSDVLGQEGPDRVLGIEREPAGVAYLLDVEAVLSQLPFSRTETFYAATEGRFTALVSVIDTGDMLGLVSWDPHVDLVYDDSGFARSSLECLRPAVSATSSRFIFVDAAIDPSLCVLSLSGCASVVLDAELPPELPAPDPVDPDWVAQCRRRDALESLILRRRSQGCDDCSCTEEEIETVYVADRQHRPEWWPCGDELEICTAGEDRITSYSAECEPQQPEPGED